MQYWPTISTSPKNIPPLPPTPDKWHRSDFFAVVSVRDEVTKQIFFSTIRQNRLVLHISYNRGIFIYAQYRRKHWRTTKTMVRKNINTLREIGILYSVPSDMNNCQKTIIKQYDNDNDFKKKRFFFFFLYTKRIKITLSAIGILINRVITWQNNSVRCFGKLSEKRTDI